jgi:hypothetical protein
MSAVFNSLWLKGGLLMLKLLVKTLYLFDIRRQRSRV